MHLEAYNLMKEVLPKAPYPNALLLDVGSLDVNGTYRHLVEAKEWRYFGLDIVAGRNVDVLAEPFDYPFGDGTFDAVISGSTMEHVDILWWWIPELSRILKIGGLLIIVTHWSFPEHHYPIDCWRIMPDGMRCLFDWARELEQYEIRIVNKTDILGMARKGREI